MTLADKYIEQAHGNRVCALFDLTADFMRGDPIALKQGYEPAAALNAAARMIEATPEEIAEVAKAASWLAENGTV